MYCYACMQMSRNELTTRPPTNQQPHLSTQLKTKTRACIPITPERTDGNAAAESSSSSSAPFVLPNVAEIASDLKALGEGVVEEVVVVGCC